MSEIRLRQADLISEDNLDKLKVLIIGVGGIGSHTALALARMGVKNMTLADDDMVSEHNCGSQGFDIADIAKLKTNATAMKCFHAVRIMPDTISKYIGRDFDASKYNTFIIAVDSMESRMDIVKTIADQKITANIILPSMGAEYLTIDTYTGNAFDSLTKFESGFFTDDEAVQEQCTAKATIYTTLLASGFICKTIKDIVESKPYVKKMAYDIKNNVPAMVFDSEGKNLTD